MIVILVICAGLLSDRIKYFVGQNEILLVLTDRLALFLKTDVLLLPKLIEKNTFTVVLSKTKKIKSIENLFALFQDPERRKNRRQTLCQANLKIFLMKLRLMMNLLSSRKERRKNMLKMVCNV